MIRGAGHHPDGAVIAPIVEAIAARLDDRNAVIPPLPDTVRLIAF